MQSKLLLRGWRILRWVLLSGVLLSVGSVLLMRWVDPVTSAFMLRERTLMWMRGEQHYQFQHQWVDAEAISTAMKLAVIASEDQRFAVHGGFDVAAIKQAVKHRRGRRMHGASTITQQVAKNLYLWPGRSWIRKGCEVYFTLLIEALWPKERILEVYLNSAEFGRGIYGVDAASRRFFHHSAAYLTKQEAALLAAVLPNPKRLRVDKPSGYVRARQLWIMRQMSRLGGASYLQQLS